jgi:hypothetical protein
MVLERIGDSYDLEVRKRWLYSCRNLCMVTYGGTPVGFGLRLYVKMEDWLRLRETQTSVTNGRLCILVGIWRSILSSSRNYLSNETG